jgi:hypothetical protein
MAHSVYMATTSPVSRFYVQLDYFRIARNSKTAGILQCAAWIVR